MKNQLFPALMLLITVTPFLAVRMVLPKKKSKPLQKRPVHQQLPLMAPGNLFGKMGDSVRDNGKSGQFKIFHDGFFSLVALDSSGKWLWAGAGTYSLDGNIYKENFRYSSVPEYIGVNDLQEYELKGDTLFTRGFTKVVFGNGEDKTASFPKFEEKRVRATR